MGIGFNAEIADNTRPMMMRGDIANNSVYWSFNAWGDSTWFLTNAANDDQHLNRQGNGLLSMSSNITARQNGQRWGFQGQQRLYFAMVRTSEELLDNFRAEFFEITLVL
jgi:hypothetical protein